MSSLISNYLAVLDVLYSASPDKVNMHEFDEVEGSDEEDADETELDTEGEAENPYFEQSTPAENELSARELSIGVDTVRKILKKFSRSGKNADVFSKFTPLKLILDCQTRWNSMVSMLSWSLDGIIMSFSKKNKA